MNWVSAFQAGAGLAPGTLALFIASMVAAAFLLFVSWVGIAQFQAWRAGRQEAFSAFWTLIMATVITMLVGFYVRP